MMDKNLGIVAIATLVAGAGFLLKGVIDRYNALMSNFESRMSWL